MTTKFISAFAFVLARPAVAATAHTAHTSTASPSPGATVHVSAPAENDRTAPRLREERERLHGNITSLFERVKHVPLSDALRSQMQSLLSDEDADRQGQRVTTPNLLLDVLDDVPPVVDAVLAGRVTGFGPAALRYTCELAVTLAVHWSERVACAKTREGASAQRSLTVDDVNLCGTELARRLEGVLPSGSPERNTLAETIARRSRSRDEALGIIEALLPLVAGVFERAVAEPAYRALLDDVHFTEPSVATLLLPVSDAIAARTAHREALSAEAATQQQLTRVEGRLRAQLARLRERVGTARTKGEMLPEVKLSRSRQRRAKKAAPALGGGAQGGGAQGGGTPREGAPR